MTMARSDAPYFRRVVFESIDNIRSRLEATDPGSYVVSTGNGRVVLAGGPLAQSPGSLAPVLVNARADAGQRQYHDGRFLVSGPLRGVDWRLTHLYSWSDLWREQHVAILLRVFTALLILAALWMLLWRMDRRVFAPALANASRVYESEALSQAIIGTAPVGLALLRRGDGAPLLQNQVARALAGGDADDDGGCPGSMPSSSPTHAASRPEAASSTGRWTQVPQMHASCRLPWPLRSTTIRRSGYVRYAMRPRRWSCSARCSRRDRIQNVRARPLKQPAAQRLRSWRR
ncbi:hypothetical protein B0X78_00735 [bacterium AM6]|nr:hypothetical protein B0X78_00735 [bacterium AM6]